MSGRPGRSLTRVKSIRLPFGEKDGELSYAELLVLVSCLWRVPSDLMT